MKKDRYLGLIVLGGLALWLTACEPEFVPKPKGYNRIDLPEPAYRMLEAAHPYTFEYSAHAIVTDDTTGRVEPHWIDITYPELGAKVQFTYKSLDRRPERFEGLNEDARRLTAKHHIKAYAIEELQVRTRSGHTATIFELSGEVPSQFQFFVTDSVDHFLRGALYFPTATQNDSLAPIIEFVKTDMVHLLNTLEWQEVPDASAGRAGRSK
jgi:gliding motility-associated lipoprotein GldD